MTGDFLIRDIDSSHILWAEKGNRFLKIEEPVKFALDKLSQGNNIEETAAKCAERYQVAYNEACNFVNEVFANVNSHESSHHYMEFDNPEDDLAIRHFIPFSIHSYDIGGKRICFRYAKPLYEHFINPLFMHHESKSDGEATVIFDLIANNGNVVLSVNRHIKGCWKESDSHLIKGMVFLQLLNVVYGKSDNEWMAVIHASAVTNHSKAIAFTASSGSGKSTIAALLHQRGYELLSDDFVPVECASRRAFPFQAALSVKEGAERLLSASFSSFTGNVNQNQSGKKVTGYLPLDKEIQPVPVKDIVFVKYTPEIDFEVEEITPIDALKSLLDETWTFPAKENAASFIDWLASLRFYTMNYSNNQIALDFIDRLFAS